ncbi:MAG: hypothetical protein KGL35_24935 [Bradyrhizobium sp.]|nr:hypothetical protein [Bradyrhizobium sp.]
MLLRHSILRHLLSTAMVLAPNDPPNGGQGDNVDGDDRIEFTDDDDEGVSDPQGESDDDPGEGDGEQDDDDDGQGDDDPAGGEPPPQQSRGNRAIGDLRRQARERADENARLTRQLADMQRDMEQLRTSARAPVETPQQRAERMALLSPEERAMEMVNEALARNNAQQQQLTHQLMDQSDRSAFEARAVNNPLFKKLAGEVERELTNLRSKGQNLPRETIATYLIGQRVVAQQGKAKPGAQQRRQQQSARPVRAQGDMGGRRQRGGGGNSAEDFEARFGDAPI